MEESPHGLFPCPRTFRRDSEELSGAYAPPPRSGDFSRLHERKRFSANPVPPNHNPRRIRQKDLHVQRHCLSVDLPGKGIYRHDNR